MKGLLKMKKLLCFLPIFIICVSCTKAPIEANNGITESNNVKTSPSPEIPLPPPEELSPTELKTTAPTTSNPPDTSKPTISTLPQTTISSISPSMSQEEETPEPTPTEEVTTGNEIGNLALDFSAKNLENIDINLSDYRGKMVFLNFWATWCGPCVRELPSIQKIHENYSDVVVLTINCGDSISDINNFMLKNNYTFNVIPDETGIISHLYYTDYIPLTLIIDETGIIKERHVGALTEENMLKLINKGEN